MIWIPVFAAGVINGVGHYWGYRSFQAEDASRNILPWGILIGGEELHNNHHAYPSSAQLSNKWWEFDIGWLYIRTLALFGLATVKKVAPRVRLVAAKAQCDEDTLQAVVMNRYDVLTRYGRSLKRACKTEIAQLGGRVASVDWGVFKRYGSARAAPKSNWSVSLKIGASARRRAGL
jgi:stearoyl-CoA desaturase (delta-9 desaturase)